MRQLFRFLFFSKAADLIADALEFMYTPWPDNSDKYALRSQLVDLIGDYIYFTPSHEVADFHSQSAPVYMYEFAHKSVKTSRYSTADWMDVVHADNKTYDFGIPLLSGFSSKRTLQFVYHGHVRKLRQVRRSFLQRCYVEEVQLKFQSLPAS